MLVYGMLTVMASVVDDVFLLQIMLKAKFVWGVWGQCRF